MTTEQVKELFGVICEFNMGATVANFTLIFGETQGEHLWVKFVAYRFDLPALYSVLDEKNRDLLIEHLSTM